MKWTMENAVAFILLMSLLLAFVTGFMLGVAVHDKDCRQDIITLQRRLTCQECALAYPQFVGAYNITSGGTLNTST